MLIKYEFEPIVKDIYFFKSQACFASNSYNHTVFFSLKTGEFLGIREEPYIQSKPIGKIIKPRWREYIEKTHFEKGGLIQQEPRTEKKKFSDHYSYNYESIMRRKE